jgi:fucose permease
MGLTLQGPNIAVQTILLKEEVSIGLSIVNLFNYLGSTLFVTVGQVLLQQKLIDKLKPILPGSDLTSLADSSAAFIRNLASKEQLPAVLDAYNDSLRSVWYLALGLAGLILVASFGMEWKNVKEQKSSSDDEGSHGWGIKLSLVERVGGEHDNTFDGSELLAGAHMVTFLHMCILQRNSKGYGLAL